jgi:MFS family permease
VWGQTPLARSGFPSAWRRLLVDVTPLRSSRDFRLLWLGELVSHTGSQIAVVALYVQLTRLTDTAAAVGLVGLVQLVPLVFASVFGGPLIDRYDRRALLLLGEIGATAASGVLLFGAVSGRPPLFVVYLGAALVALCSGFTLSARSSMIPNLVPQGMLPSALSLNQAMFSTTLIVGPAIGGVIIGEVGLAWAYGVDVASFAGAIAACALMRPQVPAGDAGMEAREARGGAIAVGWRQMTEGFRFIRGRRVLQSSFYVDLIAMIFGMPRVLFPVLAATQFDAGPEIVGVLFSAVSIGALAGALTTGWVKHVKRQGLVVLWAVGVWGLGIVGFGLSGDTLAVAIGCLAVAGAADVVSAVFRGTILADSVPNSLRGRMAAVHILVVVGGPRIGDVEAGLVASLFTPTVSVVSGGLACIVGVVVLAVLVPQFATYRAPAAAVDEESGEPRA